MAVPVSWWVPVFMFFYEGSCDFVSISRAADFWKLKSESCGSLLSSYFQCSFLQPPAARLCWDKLLLVSWNVSALVEDYLPSALTMLRPF